MQKKITDEEFTQQTKAYDTMPIISKLPRAKSRQYPKINQNKNQIPFIIPTQLQANLYKCKGVLLVSYLT